MNTTNISCKQNGIYFGESKNLMDCIARFFGANRPVVKPQNKDGHVAVIGGTSSGKSSPA